MHQSHIQTVKFLLYIKYLRQNKNDLLLPATCLYERRANFHVQDVETVPMNGIHGMGRAGASTGSLDLLS